MTSIIQSNFVGGMNLFDKSLNIANNEYALGFNVRNRTSGITGIQGPLEDINAPLGKKQGVYAFDDFVLLFVAGFAFYKNILTDSVWTQIANFVLDPGVEYFYVCAVPESTNDYTRVLVTDQQVSGVTGSNPINLTSLQDQGSLAGLIVQDGINQPWIINSDGTARKLNTYEQWTQAFHGVDHPREYVPIMLQMFHSNGILFGIAPDKNTILRSVSGRPLDFVVNVDTTGQKGGDAYTTAYNVGINAITSINTLATGELFIGTSKVCYAIALDFTSTIFAEPQFDIVKTLSVGIVNQFSFFKMLRDDGFSYHYFVDTDGVRTFGSGTVFDDNEDRNSRFTSYISSVLDKKQTQTATASFNNYLIFSVSSDVYGDILIVYDNLRQQWTSIDDYGIGSIKQFAIADQSTKPTLYAITDSKLYKLFSGDPIDATVYLKPFNSGMSNNILLNEINCVIVDPTKDGILTATDVIDGVENRDIKVRIFNKLVETKHVNFQKDSKQAWSVQAKLSWDNGGTLVLAESRVNIQTQETPIKQQLNTK